MISSVVMDNLIRGMLHKRFGFWNRTIGGHSLDVPGLGAIFIADSGPMYVIVRGEDGQETRLRIRQQCFTECRGPYGYRSLKLVLDDSLFFHLTEEHRRRPTQEGTPGKE